MTIENIDVPETNVLNVDVGVGICDYFFVVRLFLMLVIFLFFYGAGYDWSNIESVIHITIF